MELSKLTGSLAAYGNNAVQGNQSNQTGAAAGPQLDPRVAQAAGKEGTGSTPAPESTRVTLSEDGLRRAAEDAQANQQASDVAAQAANGRVPGNSSIDRSEADNPRSAAVTRTNTTQENVSRARESQPVNAENRSEVANDASSQEASRAQRVESETRIQEQRAAERMQQERQQEERRVQARQDMPPAANQAGVAAYRGVFAY